MSKFVHTFSPELTGEKVVRGENPNVRLRLCIRFLSAMRNSQQSASHRLTFPHKLREQQIEAQKA